MDPKPRSRSRIARIEEEETAEEEEKEEVDLPIILLRAAGRLSSPVASSDVETPEEQTRRLAFAALKANEAFKKQTEKNFRQKTANRARKDMPELNTDDVQEALEEEVEEAFEIADFDIRIETRTYVNKKKYKTKKKDDTCRTAFDLSLVEDDILDEFRELVEDEEDFVIISRKVSVRADHPKSTYDQHNVDDFDLAANQRVLQMLALCRQKFPRSKVTVYVEVKADMTISKGKPKAKTGDSHRTSLAQTSHTAEPPSSPPFVVAERSKKSRSSKVEEQAAVRLDKISLAGNFQRQLADRWKCRDKNCSRRDHFCFPDEQDARIHFDINSVQMESWAQAIESGKVTIHNPPLRIWQYWQEQQGPVTRDSKAPVRQSIQASNKAFQEETRSGIATLMERFEESRVHAMIAAEQDRADRLQDKSDQREDDKREREAERRRDKKRQQREDDDEERRRRAEQVTLG